MPCEELMGFVHDRCAADSVVEDPVFGNLRILRKEGVLRVDERDGDAVAPVREADIDLNDFWAFVRDFMPEIDSHYQFGVPRLDKFDMTVKVVLNTECEVRHMSSVPEALSEWEDVGPVHYLEGPPTPRRAPAEDRGGPGL